MPSQTTLLSKVPITIDEKRKTFDVQNKFKKFQYTNTDIQNEL